MMQGAAQGSVQARPVTGATSPDPVSILAVENIHKRFGATHALAGVSMRFRAGEVTALLGENGAGKSTLIKIIAGIHERDEGSVVFEGRDVTGKLSALPIAFIHQDLGLIDWMSVTENICLTRGFGRRGGLISWRRSRSLAEAALRRLGVELDPDTRVKHLGRAERSLVAIARALTTEARVIVLDEPTASLPAGEVEMLLAAIRALRAEGRAIVYVSHRLQEIFAVADRTVILRDGKVVADMPTAGSRRDEVVSLIAGPAAREAFRRVAPVRRDVALELRDGRSGEIGPVSLRVHGGEILGLVGLRGAGQETIGRVLFGLAPLDGGEIRVADVPVRIGSPSGAMRLGVHFASGDRGGESIVPLLSICENLFLNPAARGGGLLDLIDGRQEGEDAHRVGARVGLRPNHPSLPIGSLSGGNQQKAVIGRWLHLGGRILVLEDPTAGVDVGARTDIYHLLNEAIASGVAVVVITSDFEEAANLCHRTIVLYRGRVSEEIPSERLSMETLLAAATHPNEHADV